MGGSTTFTMVSTTTKFREQNPKVFGAVLKALEEANRRIIADKKTAAEILLASTGGEKGFSVQRDRGSAQRSARQVHHHSRKRHEVRHLHA